MTFKEYDKKTTFLDVEIQKAVTHSKNQQVLSEINAVINRDTIEKIVQENYPVGQSGFGNKAYPPLMLLKTILIQKWFGIKSDPDLESQINDRFSFKSFIGLPSVNLPRIIRLSAVFGSAPGKIHWRKFITSC